MKLIDINSYIEETLKKLNKEAGGEAECYTVETEQGAALVVRSWSGSASIGMTTVYHDDADDAADVLGLDSGLFYAWATGKDGDPSLMSFDSDGERATWLEQK